ncbi:MAG: DUF6477 family protein [Rhodobacterales bacterium]
MQQTSKPCHTIHNGEYHVHNTERIFALKRPTLLFKAASIALASYDRSKRLQGLWDQEVTSPSQPNHCVS